MADNKRNTVQRQLVLDAVKELNTHATAEQVYGHIVKRYPTISKATVYRCLGQMTASGELCNIGTFDGAAHYDCICRVHHHFICNQCKRVFDVEGDFSDILGRIHDSSGFDITDYRLSFNGLCWECKKQLSA